jgi:hypothetical protein
MRIIDDRQTGMFSYRDGICNRAGLNVEEEDSTAYGGIERRVGKCRLRATMSRSSGAIPGVNEV